MDTQDEHEPVNETEDAAAERCRGCRQLDASLAGFRSVTPGSVREARRDVTPSTVRVPASARSVVFEVVGFDCRDCTALVETAMTAEPGVSAASASYTTGTVRLHYHPEEVPADELVERLAALGYPVQSRDEAFSNRRAAQWADARFAAGVMAGLMVAVPYAGVIYPARFEWLLGPAVATHLREQLAATGSIYFYLNVAVLAGIVLFFSGKPMLSRARSGIANGTPNADVGAAAIAVSAYVVSSAAVLVDSSIGVHYDVVVVVVMAGVVARHADVGSADPVDGADDAARADARRTATARDVVSDD